MSRQISTVDIGARLRHLRGEESQEAFSQRVGITRSALANYETGRTKPKPSVLRMITQKLGVSEAVLLTGETSEFDDLAGALGAYDEVGTLPGLTKDEKAIIRVLRLCDLETAQSVVNALISALEEDRFDRRFVDPLTVQVDIARLYQVWRSKGQYERGVTPDTLAAILQLSKTKDPS